MNIKDKQYHPLVDLKFRTFPRVRKYTFRLMTTSLWIEFWTTISLWQRDSMESSRRQFDLICRVWFSILGSCDTIYTLESVISSSKTATNVQYSSCHGSKIFNPMSPITGVWSHQITVLLIFIWRFPPFLCLQSRFSDNLGIKQPVTEIHNETPVLQFLKCHLHMTIKVLVGLCFAGLVKRPFQCGRKIWL